MARITAITTSIIASPQVGYLGVRFAILNPEYHNVNPNIETACDVLLLTDSIILFGSGDCFHFVDFILLLDRMTRNKPIIDNI